jgi:hypothetical protein
MGALGNLIRRHPALFRGEQPEVLSDLPDGWFSLANSLCTSITAALGPEGAKHFKVLQIKEKFGQLRFYFSLSGSRDTFIDILSEEGVQGLVKKARGPEAMALLRDLVSATTEQSATVCQKCGAAAELRQFDGWLWTLCDAHAAEWGQGGLR